MSKSISEVFGRMDVSIKEEVQSLASMSSYLSKLVLVGLCLRHKLPFSELGAIFPDFDLSWVEDQLIQVMADPAISRWYFEYIDRFDADFVAILGLEPSVSRLPNLGNPVSARVQPGDGRLAVPCMPVAQRSLIGWIRKKRYGVSTVRLETMPASARP